MVVKAYPEAAISELTDSQIKDISDDLDTQFSEVMLNALTHGIHSGVVLAALWAIASRKNCENYGRPRFLVCIILILYLLATVNFYRGWESYSSFFTTINGKPFWDVYASNSSGPTPILLSGGLNAIISTILADASLIWRCWIVWGRSWRVVVIPIACTILATASRGIVAHNMTFGSIVPSGASFLENIVSWPVLYSSLILVTLLWCTILIIYRILTLSGGVAVGMRVYHRVIEILVESAALYSAVVVVLLVFEIRNEAVVVYIQELAIAIRGIVPTIIIGRIAAGRARPDDFWSGNTTVSSLQFRNHSSSQNDSQVSGGSEWDTLSRARPDLEEGLEGSSYFPYGNIVRETTDSIKASTFVPFCNETRIKTDTSGPQL
ncbi:hypothetical protein ARMGADRAFT_1064564 [Armillaria gallica]|uniref:Uncharacterized protein n=1 Tax=Armillaria gallica TaxID=47427 RepID=A0A2H3D5N3_ARMGA|nr:hypothetical protein ARMGADRAFT_1064564 [Armillaria gallica]